MTHETKLKTLTNEEKALQNDAEIRRKVKNKKKGEKTLPHPQKTKQKEKNRS